jgi:hypothetical protein
MNQRLDHKEHRSQYKLSLSALPVLVIAGSIGLVRDTIAVDSDLSAESYALYSSILGQKTAKIFAIAAEPGQLQILKQCLPRDTRAERAMADATTDQNSQGVQWRRHFDLGDRTYLLIPLESQDRVINCIQNSKWGVQPGCEPYVGVDDLFILSIPVFNASHSRAVVYVYAGCGGLCGQGSASVYVKKQGKWTQEQTGKTCNVVS